MVPLIANIRHRQASALTKKIRWLFFTLAIISFFYSASAHGLYAIDDSTKKAFDKADLSDSLLHTIDKLHAKANEIEVLSEHGFNLQEIKTGLPSIISGIRMLETNLNDNVEVLDAKSLETFQALLETSHETLGEWRKLLLGYNYQLVNMQEEVLAFHQDKLLQVFKSDSLFVRLYNVELNAIEKSWQKAKALNNKNLKQISELQGQVTIYYYKAGDLKKELFTQSIKYSKRVLGTEYPYIWKSYQRNVDKDALKFLNASILTQKELIGDYLKENIGFHAFLSLVILIAFVYWVRKNYHKLIAADKASDWAKYQIGGYLSPVPILSGIIIVLNLTPFFDLNPPLAYVFLLQVLLFFVITLFIMLHWPKQDKVYWAKIGGAILLFGALNGVFYPGTGVRLGLLIVNGFLAYNALYFVRNNREELQLSKFSRTVSYLFFFINILAVLLNITGRVTLARTFTNAILIGFVQIVALSVFSSTVKTALLLQAHTASLANNGTSLLHYDKLNQSLSRILSFIVVISWVMIFAVNMSVYRPIFQMITHFLFKVRELGSTTFTIGNILLFFLVLYLSAFAQKYIGYVFGENAEHTPPGERKGSKVVVIKLIIIVVGFMLAVMASGLPIDKITVLIGALGVGIGLGLQAIITNFVSGIILIFERPLQVGDFVEVSGYKGWVNDIGMRATRLTSSDGAEILVPNGTILSGNLVNWTLNNSQIRLELNLKIAPQEKVKEAKEIILKVLNEEEGVMKSRTPEIFYQTVVEGASELQVWFWIFNVSKQQSIRSNIVSCIYSSLESQGIKMLQ